MTTTEPTDTAPDQPPAPDQPATSQITPTEGAPAEEDGSIVASVAAGSATSGRPTGVYLDDYGRVALPPAPMPQFALADLQGAEAEPVFPEGHEALLFGTPEEQSSAMADIRDAQFESAKATQEAQVAAVEQAHAQNLP
jgi:hypothetical protein